MKFTNIKDLFGEFSGNIRVRKIKENEFRKIIPGIENDHFDKLMMDNGTELRQRKLKYNLRYLRLDKNRKILYPHVQARWCDINKFILFLSEYVGKGDLIYFGQYGKNFHEKFGFHFDGKGNVYPITFEKTYWDRKIVKGEKNAN